MQTFPPLILFALIAAVFSLPAAAADDRDRTGAGASTEGGASLGGTGIDSAVRNPRGDNDPDKRLKLERRPKPAAEPKKPDLPERAPERKIPPEHGSAPAERGNASSGATSKGSAGLSEEADKQDEEFRRKQDAERRK